MSMKIPSLILSANSLSEIALQEHPALLAARTPYLGARAARDQAAARAARIRALLQPSRFALDAPVGIDEVLTAQVEASGAETAAAEAALRFKIAERAYQKTIDSIRAELTAARAIEREPLLDAVDRSLDGLVAAVMAVVQHDDRTEQLTERRPEACGWVDVVERVPGWRARRQRH
jgi:hypothetical protein